MSPFRSRATVFFLLPYLVLVALHLLSGLRMEQPLVLADEMGYLGNARYLAGAAPMPDMRNSNFYQFGYSLLIMPAFWLFNEPVAAYKAVMVANSLLISALYFPLYFILTSFLEVPRVLARWMALASCLYPPVILYSNFALAENAFIPLYAMVTALFGKLLGSGSTRDALLFGFCASFLYTVHPRALPAVAMVLAYLVALALLRIVSVKSLLASTSAMSAVFVLTRLVNEHLKSVGWESSGEFSATKLAGRLLPGSHFPALVDRALGQGLYLIQASHGLFLLGMIAAVWLVWRHAVAKSLRCAMANPKTGVMIFVAITAAGIFFASCTSTVYSIHTPEGLQGANLIHGRHNEAFAVVFIAFALAEYSWAGFRSRQLVLRAIGVIVAILLLTFLVMIEVDDARVRHVAGLPGVEPLEKIPVSSVNGVNVPGVFPLVSMVGGLDLYPVSFAVTGSFLLIFMVMGVSKRGGMVLLALAFSLFSIYNDRHVLTPKKEAAGARLDFVSQVSRLGPIKAISYDTAYRDPALFFGVQYLMQHTRFNQFNSRRGAEPRSEAVLSSPDWTQAERLGARFVISSASGSNALWVLPGELQSGMPEPDYEDVTFAATPMFGIQDSGFYPTKSFGATPGRWTNGAATLRVPLDPRQPPWVLGIETTAPGREGVDLQVLANGVELWNRRIPARPWSKTLRLDRVPLRAELLIELNSDTFTPGQGSESSEDPRRLGIVVKGIRLASREHLAARVVEGLSLGTEPVFGIEESGFYGPERLEGRPVRWTNGAATLWVPVNPNKRRPRRLEIETVVPSRSGARLQVLANGVELWNRRIPSEAWSKTLRLGRVPIDDELVIELNSDTFSPAESRPGSGDRRELGLMVRGVRLVHDPSRVE